MHWTKVPDIMGEVFTFLPGDGSPAVMFYIPGLDQVVIDSLDKCEVGMVAVTREDAEHIYKANGIEQHRLARLQPQHMLKPLYFALFPADGQTYTVLVDGSHRYVRACMEGIEKLPAVFFPKEVWDTDSCLIEGMPQPKDRDDLHNSWSGL